MANYIIDLYRQMFISLKRGNTRGVPSKAKPIFLLSIIDYIPQMECNQFEWNVKEWYLLYKNLFEKLCTDKETPFWKPFYYMSSEPFYTLIWHTEPNERSIKYPSGKILKDNLGFAKLDDELWELLQDEENRQYLRECIIKHYFTD